MDLTQPAPHRPATATSNGLAFWTVAEVATFARVSKMTIYRLIVRHEALLFSGWR